ncbi:hypothetical protein [Arenimonas sp.]|uniref:hypothetical protein n=1 Tax=Arenimonas sp. TaxID=1872635 RepID=UPI0039E69AFD
MKELRDLLIDCRIELRKLVRDFQKTELCERLDLAIQTVTQMQAPAKAEAAKTRDDSDNDNPSPSEKSATTNQVGLAWQTAARDLKFSDPPLYERLSEKVMRLLEQKTMVDPVTELKQLGDELAGVRAKSFADAKLRTALENERDTLLGALAIAVPQLTDSGDRVGVALARIDWLIQHGAAKPGAAGAAGGSAAPVGPPPEGPMPTPEILKAVADGLRPFSKEQREWSVGEAMVLSGFQYTPVELIEKGDSHIARIIVDARNKG